MLIYRQIKKIWCIQTMEYYSALKKKYMCSIWQHRWTWRALFSMKKASHRRTNTAWFYLQEKSKLVKLIESKGISLAVQRLKLCLPVQGVWVQYLVGELRLPYALWPNNQNIKQNHYCKIVNKDFLNGPQKKKSWKYQYKKQYSLVVVKS